MKQQQKRSQQLRLTMRKLRPLLLPVTFDRFGQIEPELTGKSWARCCTRAQPWGNGRVDSTRVSQLKLRGKATERAQNPLIQIIIEVCNHAKGGCLFQSGYQEIQAVVGPCHGSILAKCKAPTNMQPCSHGGSTSISFA
jgi:hypothetical protein